MKFKCPILSFQRKVQKETETLFHLANNAYGKKFYSEQVENLPEPVKRYFLFALTEGQEHLSLVSMKYDGFFRIKDHHKWMPINGDEYYTVTPPGFVWSGKLKPSHFFWITAIDSYLQDRGSMLVKLYSMLTVSKAEGEKIDQGALSRWLSEAVLFPTALLPNENLAWEHLNDHSARLLFSYMGIDVVAQVFFGRSGEIVRFTTDRYCDQTRSLEKWSVYYKSYKAHNDIKIPTEAGAIWHLPSGNFNYARFRITDIDFIRNPWCE
jgi:hypothetical protein